MKPFLLIKLSNPKKPEEKFTGIIKNCSNVQFKVADSVALSEKGFIRDHLKTVYTAIYFIIITSDRRIGPLKAYRERYDLIEEHDGSHVEVEHKILKISQY